MLAMGRRLRRGHGQVAVAFVVLMGLALVLTPPLMNLGEVARLRTAAANAADAGALAAASHVASGTNYLARIAQYQLIAFWTVQSLFLVPYCLQAVGVAFDLVALLIIINVYRFKPMADSMIDSQWVNAHHQALLLPFSNVAIDDPLGDVDLGVEAELKALSEELQETRETRDCAYREWNREGLAQQSSLKPGEPGSLSSAYVRYAFNNPQPELVMGGGGLTFWGWTPIPCLFVMWPAWGWNVGKTFVRPPEDFPGGMVQWLEQTGGGYSRAAWWKEIGSSFAKMKSALNTGLCGYQTCIPFVIPVGMINGFDVKPVRIANSSGTVTVSVSRFRESNSQMLFWKMRYPPAPGFVSTAVASYGGADACGPFQRCDNAVAELAAVDPAPLDVVSPCVAGGGGIAVPR